MAEHKSNIRDFFSILYGETRDQIIHKKKKRGEKKRECFEITPNLPKQSKELIAIMLRTKAITPSEEA